jgi:UDP-N-acetyl-D-mannosaminuronic acid dehydrogenase
MYDVTIIGGCGHVGLPLAIILADKGKKVCIQDINEEAVMTVRNGRMHFFEESAEPLLVKNLADGNLTVTTDPSCITDSRVVIFIIGTPVDEHLNPQFDLIMQLIGGGGGGVRTIFL